MYLKAHTYLFLILLALSGCTESNIKDKVIGSFAPDFNANYTFKDAYPKSHEGFNLSENENMVVGKWKPSFFASGIDNATEISYAFFPNKIIKTEFWNNNHYDFYGIWKIEDDDLIIKYTHYIETDKLKNDNLYKIDGSIPKSFVRIKNIDPIGIINVRTGAFYFKDDRIYIHIPINCYYGKLLGYADVVGGRGYCPEFGNIEAMLRIKKPPEKILEELSQYKEYFQIF